MAIRTYKVTLDTKNSIAPEPVLLRQGDKTGAVVIDATLMDNGSPVSLSGLTPMFKANTADGKALIADSTGFNIVNASGGEFTYQVPNALSAVPGKIVTAYFSFSDKSGTQSTFDVAFIIKKALGITQDKAEDYIATIGAIGVKGAYNNLQALISAKPDGDIGIYVTTDNGHWFFWNGTTWQDGGQFQSSGIDQTLLDKINEAFSFANVNNFIANGSFATGKPDPAIPTTNDSQLSVTNYLGRKWLQITGVGNSSMRGAKWEIEGIDKVSAIQHYPLQLSFDIQSSVSQTFNIDAHFIDNNGQDMNNPINIDKIALSASEIFNYQNAIDLNISALSGVAKVVIMIYSNNTSYLGTTLLTGLKVNVAYNTNEKKNNLPELIEGKPTPSNDTVISTTEYLDQKWVQMTSTANTQYRGLKLWITNPDKISAMATYPVKINFNIQSSIDQTLGLDVHFYDVNGKDMNNAIGIDSIALKASEILNYQKEFSLDPDQLKGVTKVALFLYTSGTNDLGTVLINNYSVVLEYNTNEKLNQLPELIDGQPTGNADTVISTTKYLGQEWIKMTSTANTPYRGLKLWIDNPDKVLAMATYPVKINFNIQSSIDQSLGLDVQFYDINGKYMNNAIAIDSIALNASEILDYQKEFSLDSDKLTGVTKVALFLYTSGTNDLGTVLINNYSAVLEYNTNKTLIQLTELIDSHPTPANNTFISTTKYLDQKWLKMTSTVNTQYRGLNLWITDPDKILAMGTYPVKVNFNFQSSIDQTLGLDVQFYDINGMNNAINIDSIALKASEILNYQKEFSLDSDQLTGVTKVALFLYTSGTNDLGTVLINNYSAVLDYNTNGMSNQLPELIDRQPTPTNKDTVISNTEYLGQNWVKVTSTANTQYRGLKLWIEDPDKISAMSTYPVKINFNIQSSIDQKLGLDFHFYDNNGKDMNNSINIDNIALNALEILSYQKEVSLDSNHIKGVSKVAIWLTTSGTNDLGTVLINNYSAVLEYNTNGNSNSASSYDYKKLPEVYLNGSTSGMSGTNYVTMQFKFKENGREVDGFASTKWQGDSSLAWDKKAYRIKTFEDQNLTKKMNFKPCPLWSADNKYNLKAYYTDATLCRDVVNANIGTDLWSTQKNMPDDLATTEDFGFIDGFPVKVFINNNFSGIYSFNTTKGDYGKNAKAVISGEKYSDTTAFSALPTGGVKLDGSDFEMVSPDNPTDEIKQAVNSLITFVSTASDDDFKTQLGTHIDLESLIDYFIFLNVIENSDAAGKNQTLITWDLQKWYFHPYDLDTTYGGEFNGTIRDPLTGLLGLNSHLFTRLNSLFANEIKSRYKELRTWLTPVYVLKMYRDHINLIGESNYEDEFKLWNNPNNDKNNYNFVKIHVYKRFKLLDNLWLQ